MSYNNSLAGTAALTINTNADDTLSNSDMNVIQTIADIKKYSSKTGISEDINEIVEKLQEAHLAVRKKQEELEITEAIAWASSEPAIVEARKNLYMVTKLTYGDEIKQLTDENRSKLAESFFVSIDSTYGSGALPPQEKSWAAMANEVYTKMRSSVKKRHRKAIEKLKKLKGD